MPQKDPRKTERATPRRIQKAREEGNVPRSEEVSKVVVLIAGIISLRFFIEYMRDNFYEIFRVIYKSFNISITENTTFYLLFYCMKKLLIIILPILFFIAICSIISIRLQIGHLFTTKVFELKWPMLNFVENLKNRLFSLKAFVELTKNLLQVLPVSIVAYFVIKNELKYLPSLFYQNPLGIAENILLLLYKTAWMLIIPLIILAAMHLKYTRWEYQENLKMTKEEVKDEHKQLYGDPKVKSEQRKRMQKVVLSRMMSQVPKADVVITNPTHIAVALMYDIEKAPAPIVVAKGKGLIAEKIKKLAKENNIPIKEDKPLAQALYKSVEVGEMIPEEFYQAVAAILATLEKFRKKYRRAK